MTTIIKGMDELRLCFGYRLCIVRSKSSKVSSGYHQAHVVECGKQPLRQRSHTGT